MEDDLRLCSVKLGVDLDRRFCFEVLSPSKYAILSKICKKELVLIREFSHKRSHMLQADSEEGCQQWITAMQAGINAALHQPMREKSDNVKYQIF